MDTPNYKELYEKILFEFQELKLQLKKYTSSNSKKKYYENNKEEINKKTKEYREKTNYHKNIPDEKLKEYRKRAYEKQKLKKIQNNNLENDLKI